MNEEPEYIEIKKIGFWEFCDRYYWGFWFFLIIGIIYIPDPLQFAFGRIAYMGGGILVVTFFLFIALITIKRYWREIVDAIFGYARLYEGENMEEVTANQIMNMVFSDDISFNTLSQIMPQRKAQKVLSVLNKVYFNNYRVNSEGSASMVRYTTPLLVKDKLNKNRTTFYSKLLLTISDTGKYYTKDQIKKHVIPILQDVL